MSTITQEQTAAIAAKLEGMTLPRGLGDERAACSIAAINLALTGRLTDEIPACMSAVIGKWIIGVQDAMPHDMRNSARWKSLLPLAAGTGRDHEQERLTLILDWMLGTVLPTVQPIADKHGFGGGWLTMTTERTATAAAAAAAKAAKVAEAWAATAAAAAAKAAKVAEAWAAAGAAAKAAEVAEAGAWAAAGAGAAAKAAKVAEWGRFDPCSLLEQLIAVGEKE
jgi:hypothetical protein